MFQLQSIHTPLPISEEYECSVTPTILAQAISSICIPKIQLGPNWQQSTTKMDVARVRCNADSSEVFYINDNNI